MKLVFTNWADRSNAECIGVHLLIDAYLSGELPDNATQSVGGHLRQCHTCSKKFTLRHSIKDRVSLAVSRDEIPAGVKQRISRIIRELHSSQ